jgi:hypothetical protein
MHRSTACQQHEDTTVSCATPERLYIGRAEHRPMPQRKNSPAACLPSSLTLKITSLALHALKGPGTLTQQ